MIISEVMTPNAEFISPEESLVRAAGKMRDTGVGALPVAEDERLIGMISYRDIAIQSSAGEANPHERRVRDVMTENIVYTYDDNNIAEAAELMKEKKIRHLIVLDRLKRRVGVLSLCDVITGTPDKQLAGEVLKSFAEAPSGNYGSYPVI